MVDRQPEKRVQVQWVWTGSHAHATLDQKTSFCGHSLHGFGAALDADPKCNECLSEAVEVTSPA